ncbi:MAG: hypothetical protein ACRDTX_29580 [Pseudonocardiaceae bacterium]
MELVDGVLVQWHSGLDPFVGLVIGGGCLVVDTGITSSSTRRPRSRGATVVSTGHAFVQNIRRSHYELGGEEVANLRVLTVFTELALAI